MSKRMCILIKKFKKTVLALTLVVTTAFSAVPAIAAVNFKDVKPEDWFHAAVQWGTSNGMVSGYPDGTFLPNNSVSESEFLKLFIAAYEPVEAGQGGNWADPYYAFADKMNYPTSGNRNAAISRGAVAEIVSGAAGVNYKGDNAIVYLLGNGLAKGKMAGEISVGGYKAKDLLTRAEAVQFIKNAKENGLSELNKRPATGSPTNQLPQLPGATTPPVGQVPPGTEPAVADFYNKLITDGIIAKYPQFEAKVGKTSITLSEGKSVASVVYDKTGNKINQIILWKNDAKGASDFAIDAIKAIGAPMTKEAEFKKAIENSRTSTDVVEFRGSGWTITITPHQTATDTTYIVVKKS
ncbi:S-layer homology domain-containing protein [Brevibacillus invocatus]|uniref:S-layer homology domain-containing protein n=1 Tax=Brevibacillus invocatus TaxID=173959 RepID=UPI00203D3964|nr:S-layer homology domain-containing protein [Brevibacillus invocatus]MCM3430923.1 S-layer homology domain-containing protein [Brevibacillus invocatus]